MRVLPSSASYRRSRAHKNTINSILCSILLLCSLFTAPQLCRLQKHTYLLLRLAKNCNNTCKNKVYTAICCSGAHKAIHKHAKTYVLSVRLAKGSGRTSKTLQMLIFRVPARTKPWQLPFRFATAFKKTTKTFIFRSDSLKTQNLNNCRSHSNKAMKNYVNTTI